MSNLPSMIEAAIKYQKSVRIGVNWGSLDQAKMAQMMDDNGKLANPLSADELMREALNSICVRKRPAGRGYWLAGQSNYYFLQSQQRARFSQSVSRTGQTLRISAAFRLNRSGHGQQRHRRLNRRAVIIVARRHWRHDSRFSLTPEPNETRTKEVIVAQEILQTMGIRSFTPLVTACPGCGRTTSTYFQELAMQIQSYLRNQMPVWRKAYPGVEDMSVAVMGCVVNGPGESKLANIGISLPGTGEMPVAPVFVDGQKTVTLKGDNIAQEFQQIVENYVETHYKDASGSRMDIGSQSM